MSLLRPITLLSIRHWDVEKWNRVGTNKHSKTHSWAKWRQTRLFYFFCVHLCVDSTSTTSYDYAKKWLQNLNKIPHQQEVPHQQMPEVWNLGKFSEWFGSNGMRCACACASCKCDKWKNTNWQAWVGLNTITINLSAYESEMSEFGAYISYTWQAEWRRMYVRKCTMCIYFYRLEFNKPTQLCWHVYHVCGSCAYYIYDVKKKTNHERNRRDTAGKL